MKDENRDRKELEDENYCLREIIKHINEGVILTNKECLITVFNPAKENMEQMSASEVIGKISWDAYSHSSKEISEHKKVFDTGTPILNAYRPHAYVGEVPVYIYYSTYPIFRDKEKLGVYTISRNETLLRDLLYETIEHKRLLGKEEVKRTEEVYLAGGTHFTFSDIVGSSENMKNIIREAQMVAPLNTPILITGETGTGKEVLAQSIHNFGVKRKKFVAVNCAAIPENLVESLLFGSVRGAYTGAVDSIGLFREAEDGTLFLDEINSTSTVMQAKLLRALQEMSVRPVGGLKEYPIKCRLICASNEAPEVLVKEKHMRSDLFFRISGFCLSIPPLRERSEDAVELAYLYIKRYNNEFGRHIRRMSPELEQWIASCAWPGNTRELQNVIQNMMLQTGETEEELYTGSIPIYARNAEKVLKEHPCLPEKSEAEGKRGGDMLPSKDLNQLLKAYQRELIEESLIQSENNLTKAAEGLGIGRQNLLSRMKRLNIQKSSKQQ